MCDAFDFYVHFYGFSWAPRIIGFESAVWILCFEGDSGPRFPFEIWFWKVLALKLLIFGPHLDTYHDNFCFAQENYIIFNTNKMRGRAGGWLGGKLDLTASR